jgi:hypothetical protein
VRLQTLRNAAVWTHARSIDPALILLAGIDTSFDLDFNDYLHPASFMRSTSSLRNWSETTNPDLFHFPAGNFLTSSVFIVYSVSGNRLRANNNGDTLPSE